MASEKRKHAILSTESLWQKLPPMISPAETLELLKKARAGDIKARNKCIEGNLRLVAATVMRSIPQSIRHKIQRDPGIFEDLLQVGCIGRSGTVEKPASASGLLQAIEWFDFDRGINFSTYATPWIRAAVRDEIANRAVGGRTVFELTRIARKAAAKLTRDLGTTPSIEEITAELNREREGPHYTVTRIRDVLQSAGLYHLHGTVELDECEDDETPDACKMIDTKRVAHRVHAVLEQLDPQEADFLKIYFGMHDGEENNYREIARMRGVTHSQAAIVVQRGLTNFKRIYRQISK